MHNCDKSTFICALAINTHIKVIHAFAKFYYFDSIKKHILKHGFHTSGALSISTLLPQHNTVQVNFTLHVIKSYNGIGHAGHFVLDIGALWRYVVSLTPCSFALSLLKERSHWEPLNKTSIQQVSNFS